MKFVFRVDASDLIGSGHVMRCVSLATALRDKYKADICFVCREGYGSQISFLESNSFEVLKLPPLKEIKISCFDNRSEFLGKSQGEDVRQTIKLLNS